MFRSFQFIFILSKCQKVKLVIRVCVFRILLTLLESSIPVSTITVVQEKRRTGEEEKR